MAGRRRYKRYLNNDECDIPRSTKVYRDGYRHNALGVNINALAAGRGNNNLQGNNDDVGIYQHAARDPLLHEPLRQNIVEPVINCGGEGNVADLDATLDPVQDEPPCHRHHIAEPIVYDGREENIVDMDATLQLNQLLRRCQQNAEEHDVHMSGSDEDENESPLSSPSSSEIEDNDNDDEVSNNSFETRDEDGYSTHSNDSYIEDVENEDDDFVNPPEAHPEEPLYPSARISRKQSEVLILAYATRHGLSDLALQDLLQLINCHTPVDAHGSKYSFLKDFKNSQNVVVVYYCSQCKHILKFVDVGTATCEECGLADQDKNALHLDGCFFFHEPLGPQLLAILDNEELRGKISQRRQNISDVTSGRVYEEMKANGVIGENDITVQFNTDGASSSKSSKASIWPLQVAINELPFKERKENIILASLWPGSQKPRVDTFFQPFIEELQELHHNGLTLADGTHVKVHCTLSSVDSVARPLLQNIKQFNGSFGCSFCLKEGVRVNKGRGTARVYPGLVEELRTEEQHIRDLHDVVQSETSVHGVKGPSALMLIPHFNIIDSFVPDYMHNVLLGCVRWFLFALIDSKNSDKPWYISKPKYRILCERIESVKPPSEVTRLPRSLDEIKLWKASEFRTFLLYYSLPCLNGLMPRRYFNHWFLLVFSIRVYLGKNISQCAMRKAKKALELFVIQTEELYGVEFISYNVHTLLHIPKSVEDWGALWASSCFMYEHFNGVLLKLFSGTQHISAQICKKYERVKHTNKLLTQTEPLNRWHPLAEELLKKLTGTFLNIRTIQINSVVAFGSPEIITLTLPETIVVEQLLGFQLPHPPSVLSYQRFICNGMKLHTNKYQRLRSRTNNVVSINNGRVFMEITDCIQLTNDTNERIFVVLGHQLQLIENDLCRNLSLNIYSSEFLKAYDPEARVPFATLPTRISQKCVNISVDGSHFVCSLVNPYERD